MVNASKNLPLFILWAFHQGFTHTHTHTHTHAHTLITLSGQQGSLYRLCVLLSNLEWCPTTDPLSIAFPCVSLSSSSSSSSVVAQCCVHCLGSVWQFDEPLVDIIYLCVCSAYRLSVCCGTACLSPDCCKGQGHGLSRTHTHTQNMCYSVWQEWHDMVLQIIRGSEIM